MTQAQRIAIAAVVAMAAASAAGFWVVYANASISDALGLPDAGTLTRWGLAASRVFRDLTMAGTIGAAVVAAFLLPGPTRPDPEAGGGQPAPSSVDSACAVARWMALLWATSSFTVLAFSYSELAAIPVSQISVFELRHFVGDFDFGRALAVNIGLALLVCITLSLGRTSIFRGLAAVISLIALWPLATTGHAAGALNHDHAVNSQAAHLLGVSLWFGGLLAIGLVWRRLGQTKAVVVKRFSGIALWAFVLVAISGVLAAVLRVGSWSGLQSTYGALVVLKVLFLVWLGVAGIVQRRRFIKDLESDDSRGFTRLALIELVVMAAAIATGVALGATPPPRLTEPRLSTAESLLGFRFPGPLDGGAWLTAWRLDSLWVPISLLAITVYVSAMVKLRRRGDAWPVGRALAWTAGWAAIIWATSAAPGVYGDLLFSAHMMQHMTIATTGPILMVLGAPVTLALRALPKREDNSQGPREWLLVIVHSRVARFFGHPLVAAAMFVGGMVVFYYSGLFELSLRSHTAHNLMVAHFLVTGYLFASVIVGIDPGFKRPPYPMRILLVMVVFGFHALFAVSLMNSNEVLAADWFNALDRPWGPTPLEDQHTGASIGWLLGDYPLAILAGALIWSWVRDDKREARRLDRQATRDGDKARADYNEYLETLRRDGRVRRLVTEVPRQPDPPKRGDPDGDP